MSMLQQYPFIILQSGSCQNWLILKEIFFVDIFSWLCFDPKVGFLGWDFKSLNPTKTRSLRLLRPSKAQVKTRGLDGLDFSKNQPSWVLLSLRLESSVADDCKFRKIFYICTIEKTQWNLIKFQIKNKRYLTHFTHQIKVCKSGIHFF